MEQTEINKRNEAILRYLGYIYTYTSIEDFSDIGGLETNCIIYSKIPLTIDYCLASDHWLNDRDKFMCITVSGWDINRDMSELQYHSNWSWLMPVVLKVRRAKYFIELNSINQNEEINYIFKQVSDYCINLKP